MIKKIVLIVIIIFFGNLFWNSFNSPVDKNAGEKLFLVNKGETAKQVAENLKRENLIKSAFYFKYIIWRGGFNIKAGEYLINSGFDTKSIVKILTLGDVINREKQVRVIEGWNLKDIGGYLEDSNIVSAKDFLNLAVASLDDWKFNFSKPGFLNDASKQASLEGYLFPDTYRISKDATIEDIIKKMLVNFDKKLTSEMRAEIKRQKKTVYEIVTMASIIEKEVRSTEDMKIVSGIFWDRIKSGQALQSCATLAYILGVNKPQYSLEDTKINSLYNTYKYRGLPPGPIANPGLNAITAAIYPVFTGYNYFLTDPATDKTIYSRSLDEHNMNKYKYLK